MTYDLATVCAFEDVPCIYAVIFICRFALGSARLQKKFIADQPNEVGKTGHISSDLDDPLPGNLTYCNSDCPQFLRH